PPAEVVAGEREDQLALQHGPAEVEGHGGALATDEAAVQDPRSPDRGHVLAHVLEEIRHGPVLVVHESKVAEVGAGVLVQVSGEHDGHAAGGRDVDPALDRGHVRRRRGQAQGGCAQGQAAAHADHSHRHGAAVPGTSRWRNLRLRYAPAMSRAARARNESMRYSVSKVARSQTTTLAEVTANSA